MSSGLSTCDSIALIKRDKLGGLDITTYPSIREMVESLLNSGYICNGYWATKEHLRVIKEFKKYLRLVEKDIIADQKKEKKNIPLEED